MRTAREWKRSDCDRADRSLIRREAAWLREGPDRAEHAGLASDDDAQVLAALLDVLVDRLPTPSRGSRRASTVPPARDRATGRHPHPMRQRPTRA